MEILQDILRFLPLVFWIIPVALIAAVILSALAIPAISIGGPIMRLLTVRSDRLKGDQGDMRVFTCSIDADCPRGYICNNGRCVPVQNR